MKIVSGIYVVSCAVTGDVFVGSSAMVSQKMKKNLHLLKSGIHYNLALQSLASSYGVENIQTEFVCECPPDDFEQYIVEAEQYIYAKRL